MFCLRCLLLPVLSGRFHNTSPLLRLTAQSDRLLPSASATFRKIVSPQITGVAPLHCGSCSFHATFSVGLHFTGRFFSALTPSPAGPRQAGQLAEATTPVARLIVRISRALRMLGLRELSVIITLTFGPPSTLTATDAATQERDGAWTPRADCHRMSRPPLPLTTEWKVSSVHSVTEACGRARRRYRRSAGE